MEDLLKCQISPFVKYRQFVFLVINIYSNLPVYQLLFSNASYSILCLPAQLKVFNQYL